MNKNERKRYVQVCSLIMLLSGLANILKKWPYRFKKWSNRFKKCSVRLKNGWVDLKNDLDRFKIYEIHFKIMVR